jgi:hypothetical protein
MLQRIKSEVTKHLMTVQVRTREEVEQAERLPAVENEQYQHADYASTAAGAEMAEGEDVGEDTFTR